MPLPILDTFVRFPTDMMGSGYPRKVSDVFSMADCCVFACPLVQVQLFNWLAGLGSLLVVDIRTRQEYYRGHVPRAVNIPLDGSGKLLLTCSIVISAAPQLRVIASYLITHISSALSDRYQYSRSSCCLVCQWTISRGIKARLFRYRI